MQFWRGPRDLSCLEKLTFRLSPKLANCKVEGREGITGRVPSEVKTILGRYERCLHDPVIGDYCSASEM